VKVINYISAYLTHRRNEKPIYLLLYVPSNRVGVLCTLE